MWAKCNNILVQYCLLLLKYHFWLPKCKQINLSPKITVFYCHGHIITKQACFSLPVGTSINRTQSCEIIFRRKLLFWRGALSERGQGSINEDLLLPNIEPDQSSVRHHKSNWWDRGQVIFLNLKPEVCSLHPVCGSVTAHTHTHTELLFDVLSEVGPADPQLVGDPSWPES